MKLLEKIKSQLKMRPLTPLKIILIFVLVLVVSIGAWYYLPAKRVSLQFWINEMFVIILIIVTAIYVNATYNLVEETKKLRPSGRLSIYFLIGDSTPMNGSISSYDDSYTELISEYNKVNAKIVKKNVRTLIMEIRNVGQRSIDKLSLDIEVNIPQLSSYIRKEPYKYTHGLKVDDKIYIGVAKFYPVHSITASARDCKYNDGFEDYSAIQGEPDFIYGGLQNRLSVGSSPITKIKEEV